MMKYENAHTPQSIDGRVFLLSGKKHKGTFVVSILAREKSKVYYRLNAKVTH